MYSHTMYLCMGAVPIMAMSACACVCVYVFDTVWCRTIFFNYLSNYYSFLKAFNVIIAEDVLAISIKM